MTGMGVWDARSTNNHGVADDLVQEALERTWLAWSKLDDTDPFPWTRKVMLNLNIDRVRRRRRRPPETSLEGVDPADQRPVTSTEDTIWIRDLLAELAPRERAIVVLRYLEDLTEAQTARELDVAIGTVKSTCHRAGQASPPGRRGRVRH